MKKPLKITDELLLDYIDGSLTPEQTAQVNESLNDPGTAERLKELKQIDQFLSTQILETPSRNFTSKVMANLHKPIVDQPYYSRRNGFIVLALALLTVIAGSMFMTESVVSIDLFNSIDLTRYNAPIEIPQVNMPDTVNLKILTDGLLFTMVILALLLLDRVVLRPFFRSRRTEVQF
ncbi:hypothetical protein C900_04010 [Fulvivirga imtechensis AK7]|uniref:Uncharacterized protein n=1 Tax=Fulvivirga imtechensis AK7 TaxID=1237149 RepID=L8JND0_9BACT|nr:hypothetical protein [Fulvivirga imtechensis]ELR70325.1 hypothetical protein C900_04010 [Fulvivirga imtechensis AK7]